MKAGAWGAFVIGICAAPLVLAESAQDGEAFASDNGPHAATGEHLLPSLSDMSFETVVSANRRTEKAFDASRAISAKDARRIQHEQARDIPEAVGNMPGVFLQRTNRGAGSPIIRGMVGPANLLVLDGVRLNNSTYRTGPNQYLALVDPWSIHHIEVVRGPSSVLFGNGAMGGVIALESTPVQPRQSFGLEGASFAQSADFGHGLALQLTDSIAGAGFLLGGSVGQWGALRTGGGQRVVASDYGSAGLRAKGAIALAERWQLKASYFGATVRGAGRADQLGIGDVRFYDNDDHLAYSSIEYNGDGHLKHFVALFSYHRMVEDVQRFSCLTTNSGLARNRQGCALRSASEVLRIRRNQDIVQTLGLDGRATWSALSGRLSVVAGIDAYGDHVSSSFTDARASDGFNAVGQARGNFSEGSLYGAFGAYMHAQGDVLTFGPKWGMLRVSGGVRVSHFEAMAPDVPGLGAVRYHFTGAVGSAGVQWLRPGLWSLSGSFVQGFRAPNLQETTVLGDTGSKFETPNASLRPERSDAFELAARGYWRGLELAVTGFYSFLQDAIDEKAGRFDGQDFIDGKPVVRRVNAPGGTYRGVEAALDWPHGAWGVFGNATYMQGALSTGDGQRIAARRVPPLFGILGVRWQPLTHLNVEVFAQGALQQTALHPSDALDLRICETQAYSGVLADPCRSPRAWLTANLRAGWRINETLRLEAALYNLTDRRYRMFASGMDAAGIDARVTMIGTLE